MRAENKDNTTTRMKARAWSLVGTAKYVCNRHAQSSGSHAGMDGNNIH